MKTTKEYNVVDKRYHLVMEIAIYITDNKCTLRQAAKHFGIPKSTIHNWIHKYLKEYDSFMYDDITWIFRKNKEMGRKLGGKNAHKKKQEN